MQQIWIKKYFRLRFVHKTEITWFFFINMVRGGEMHFMHSDLSTLYQMRVVARRNKIQ